MDIGMVNPTVKTDLKIFCAFETKLKNLFALKKLFTLPPGDPVAQLIYFDVPFVQSEKIRLKWYI